MQGKFIFSLIVFLFTTSLRSQIGCGHDIVKDIQKNTIENYDELEKLNNIQIKNYIDEHFVNNTSNKITAGTNYVIPVVFHVVYPVGQAYGTGNNISYSQIQSQIAALNAAFGKNYPAYNGQTHPAYAQNTNIQFCLAKTAMPAAPGFYNGPGGIENGVMRYPDNVLTNHQMTPASATALLGLTHPTASYFPFGNYLNIWVVSSIGGGGGGTIMGYSPKPLMGAYPLDGVVMRSDVIGDNTTGNTFTLGFGLAQGKALCHEIGHYFNLLHIFEGGCTGKNAAGAATDPCDLNGDMICDIEPCTTQNINCNVPIPNTCVATYTTGTTNLDMINSYMSYADDDCWNTFTLNQTQRMWATLNTMRVNLWQATNLAATGVIGTGSCISPYLITHINVNPSAVCINVPVQLSNSPTGNTATSWNWSMPGANITTATTSSVTVTYTAVGVYWVKLSISDGTITAKDSAYIAVTSCTLDSTKLNQANWYYGTSCGLNFNSGSPVPTLPSAINTSEPTAAISDSLGNLLFYTDGQWVWNKNHVQMTNLGGLLYGGTYSHSSACEGAMIVPMPNNKKKYYVFSTTQQPTTPTGLTRRLTYSIIDMNLNGGLGEIAILNQNVPGPNFCTTEGQTAIPHCNGYDYWVISKGAITAGYADKIASYLVTANGISAPVISASFSVPVISNNYVEYLCSMEASPDGKLLSVMDHPDFTFQRYVKLYSFNNKTGAINLLNSIPVSCGIGITCLQFSPDSKKLYVGTNVINQFDVTIPTAVTNSVVFNNNQQYRFQTGPDNKIYMASVVTTTALSVISFPNVTGTACAVSLNTIPYLPSQTSAIAFPNFIDAVKPPGISTSFIATPINCTTVKFMVDSCWLQYTPSWNFGDGNTGLGLTVNHTYTTSGTYPVKLVLSIGSFSFPAVTQNITVLSNTTNITGPGVICKGTPFLNSYAVSNIAGATYNWSGINTTFVGPNNLYNVNVGTSGMGSATLSVQIIHGGCITNATKTIIIDSVPNTIITNTQTAICLGDTLIIQGNPMGGIYSGGGVSGNVFHSAITGLGNQSVYYTYTNSNACSKTAALNITVNSCVGIAEINKNDLAFYVYPNPNSGEFTISLMRTSSGLVVQVYNYLGQLILSENMTEQNKKINLQEQSNGIYFVRIMENNKPVHTVKIVKE